MDLVIDSNILFAALLKESETSDILFKHILEAVTLSYLFSEVLIILNHIVRGHFRGR